MISWPSAMIPRIASQVLPRGFLPMALNTFSRRSTCPSVSSRWMVNASCNFSLVLFFASLGSVLSSCFSTKIDVLEKGVEKFFHGLHDVLHLKEDRYAI